MKQYVGKEEVALAYSKVGYGVNVVLCIHGLTRNSRDFDYLTKFLEKKYTVISIDIFGHGKSSWLKNTKKYNYSTYCSSVIKLIDFLKIKKVNIIGTSMGGIIAMYTAAYNNTLVNKIVLNDVGAEINIVALKELSFYVKKFPKFKNKSAANCFLKKFFSPLKLENEEHIIHMVENSIVLKKDGSYYLNHDPAIVAKFFKSVHSLDNNVDLWHIWKKISQSVLILRGQESKFLTYDTVKKMISDRANVQFIEYPDTGHTPSLLEDIHAYDIVRWLNIK